jgi:hypothetical protein
MSTPALRLKPGDQLASTVCTARVVVVRVPAGQGEGGQPVIECGGSPMVAATPGAKPAPPGPDAATVIGKRYVNGDGDVELLCTSSGTGPLGCDGAPMTLKAAKPLPASD